MKYELEGFMYELGRYAEHMHVLRDTFESLSESERQLIMEEAPEQLKSPEERFVLVYDWMDKLHKRLGIKNEQ